MSSPSPTLREELAHLRDHYVRHSTIHGIIYVGSVNSSARQKLVWGMTLLATCGGGIWLCHHIVFGADSYKTTTLITDPNLKPYLFAFPALTFCPLNKARRTVGERLLLEHLGVPGEAVNSSLRDQMLDVMRTLVLMELPDLSTMQASIYRAKPLLRHLHSLNITDFMLKALPRCEDLFSRCYWHGLEVDCCKILHLQQSEMGFCYTFNSLTTLRSRHCTTEFISPIEEAWTAPISAAEGPECQLRRTSTYGPGSALKVYLKELPDDDIIHYRRRRGLVVCLHHNIVMPRPAAGYLMQAQQKENMGLAIRIEVTKVSKEVLARPVASRGCLGPTEQTEASGASGAWLLGAYSETTCRLECELLYIFKECRCVPYMFEHPDFPACTVAQLDCLTGLDVIRLTLPPHGFPEDGIRRRGINCSHCLRTCEVVSYVIRVRRTWASIDPDLTRAGAVNVFVDIMGSIKMFRVNLAFTDTNRITFVGGIAGLCMGISIVSVVETLYYLLRLGALLSAHYLRLRRLRRRIGDLDLDIAHLPWSFWAFGHRQGRPLRIVTPTPPSTQRQGRQGHEVALHF